ncbi:E3 ubiquitin-protein ligase RNF186 [Dermochelys coriacea]|uniref:E3 ubiquitin-protein ligase RNF186 n=1 Tax=Dermochelys coriacea TaxID=27794 RepID=UPI0018E88166|nr:E3 ubiquitin-protein ligase RNF186 [Dermochelys coriacea]XP_038232312.1 E3 ubiquitin-protein ligase RNF186 [Dermochelys coriacea]
MEGSTDKLHIENEFSSPGPSAAEMDRLASTKEAADTDRLGSNKKEAADKDCPGSSSPSAAELNNPDASKRTASEMNGPNSIKPPVTDSPDSCKVLVSEMDHRHSSKALIADMDCLICFNRYNIYRRPKLLACQHAFCEVCLKLILQNEDNTWMITCPLCRKPTVVFGGLIRTLLDKEDIIGRLESTCPNAEIHVSPEWLHDTGGTQSSHATIFENQDMPSINQTAVQRLVLLLLLMVILIILVLPFVYTGLIKWVLCLVLMLGLIMSLVLCCNPNFNCSSLGISVPSFHKKESDVIAIA